ncbi:MAG TPA: MarR family winged helix-turn-helix transcriptional regulator [Pilimelia sp.]|nr:MarR family winged helix-turn-helix transcriptional regulator [Pilimelia sp.]
MDFDRTAHTLATGLARVAVAAHAAGDALPAGLERTVAQQQVLLLLSRRRDVYPLTELSADLGMTAQATLSAITTLAREGLVTVSPSPSYAPHDVRVVLTVQGRRQAPELLNWAADLLAELHQLDDGGQRRLLDVVTTHIRQLQRGGHIPVTKMCVTCRFFDGYAYPGSVTPHHCWLVDGAFGHLQLRLRCPDAEPADRADADGPNSVTAPAGANRPEHPDGYPPAPAGAYRPDGRPAAQASPYPPEPGRWSGGPPEAPAG